MTPNNPDYRFRSSVLPAALSTHASDFLGGVQRLPKIAVPLSHIGPDPQVSGWPRPRRIAAARGSTCTLRLRQIPATIELFDAGLAPHATIPALGPPKLSMPEIKFT